MIETLETRKGFHRIGEDTFQTICAMLKRWGDDPEVREAMYPTLDFLCARQTGRY